MAWTNYHVHSCYCHGIGKPEEYVKEAISQGVTDIGFSSHAPLPYWNQYVMNEENLNQYINDVNLLKDKYRGEINIYLGLEVDYIPGILRCNNFRKLGMDYIIGSNHFIGQNSDGKFIRPEFIDSAALSKINPKRIVGDYYHSICQMAQLEKPDILAHLDFIKKLNLNNQIFDENENWYKALVIDTLDCISKTDCIVEVNTSNAVKRSDKWLLPSLWILEKCFELGIKLTLSSDAHIPADVTAYFEKAKTIIKDIGYSEIAVLTPEGWKPRKI